MAHFRTLWHACVVLASALFLGACGGGGGGGSANATPSPAPSPAPPSPFGTGPSACTAGNADGFRCSGISLGKRVPLATMGATGGNDVWGWFDAQSAREYALVGLINGTAFVDVTDPRAPIYLGRLPTETVESVWRDIKVYRDHAYIVADNAGSHGMQVFDLTRLRGVSAPQTFSADFVYRGFANAHNVAINEATGFAYAVGTNSCGGGLHMIDIGVPATPVFAGCHSTPDTHDTQCVVYHGPDVAHWGREICVSSNEDHVEVVDVTTKWSPVSLARITYPQLGFVHQGWLTEDQRFFLLGDEGDEISFDVRTRTHVFDLSDLDAPAYLYPYEAATNATDHNLYVRGRYVFAANYASGLRVLEIGDLASRGLAEIASFDTFPAGDQNGFSGAWSVYPYLPSGTILVGDRSNGLFVLSVDVLPPDPYGDQSRRVTMLDLGADGFDTALDEPRGQVYVSLPARNEIAVVSLTSQRVVDRIPVPGTPQGIDLGLDGTRLFAALRNANAVAVIDPVTRAVRTIDLADQSGSAITYDVLEAAPGRLFVTSDPSSGGLAYVVQVRLDQGETLSQAADGRIIRAAPVLARSRDSLFAYVGEGFSPNSLYKLSLADPDAGVVLEDAHGSVGGTDNLVLNAAGTRIALRSGQVLRTGSFIEEGRIPAGISAASSSAEALMLSPAGGVVGFFDFATLQAIEAVDTGCTLADPARRLHAYEADEQFVLMSGREICVTADASVAVPDPYPALRFTDIALETCVRASAQSQGLTRPEEFLTLDCGASAGSIRSLAGLDALTNLVQLDLSGSGVFDVTPLAGLDNLQVLTLRNTAVGDLTPLLGPSSLTALDVTGSAGAACADLDALAAGGVSVTADLCAEWLRVDLGGIGFDMELDAAPARAFVSVPSRRAILAIDLSRFSVAQTWATSEEPRGIDLSADGATLYAALNNLGSVAYIDTTTGGEQLVDVSALLGDNRTYDVAEVQQDRIVVSASPGSAALAYIVEVRRDQGNAAQRVASDTVIRDSPFFAVSGNGGFVYVGAGLAPNFVYKLDASQAAMPIVDAGEYGSVYTANHLSLSPSGSRLHTASGHILSAVTITQVGQLPPGVSLAAADGSAALVADAPDAVGIYDAVQLNKIGRRETGCNLQSIARLAELPGGGVIVMGDDLLCGSRTVPY